MVGYFCNTLKHRGEILKRVFDQKLGNVTKLANRVGYNRKSVYRHFEDPILPTGILLKYGKALNHDFTFEIPEMRNELMMKEPSIEYQPKTFDELQIDRDAWRTRYIDMLERYNELMEKYTTLLEDRNKELGELNEKVKDFQPQ